uniref:V-type proton ATPase subunit S1 n=1 Tax=Callorhinchus milii TaxID=7868 RepID=V9KMN9_CALMI
MAAVGRLLLLRLSVLTALTARAAAEDHVPVLVWSTGGALWSSQPPPPNAGHILSAEQLSSYLSPALREGPKNVVLFVQDKLSVDDFTAYGGAYGNKQDNAFPNIQSAVEGSPWSLVLPAVDWRAAGSLAGVLQAQTGVSPLYVDQETLGELRLNASLPSLLVVRLPFTSSAILMPPKEALAGNDQVIGQVLSDLKSNGIPFLAIYSASRPSRIMREVSDSVLNTGRHLLATEPEPLPPPLSVNQTGGVGPCILLWVGKFLVSDGDTTVDLANLTIGKTASVNTAQSSCSNSSVSLVLSYGNVDHHNNLKITFNMTNRLYPVSAKHWFTLDTVEISTARARAGFNVSHIYAPALYSYHCRFVLTSNQASPAFIPLTPDNKWAITLQDFQVQGFGVKELRFSYASDCAGFFTPAIWMGLLTSLLLIAILSYGLHMIINLKTMDRFDDPKGPTISVPQTE